MLFSGLVGGTRAGLDTALPAVPAVCRETVASLVDESAGQILPAFRNPTAAWAGASGGAGGSGAAGFAGSVSAAEAQCFSNPAFLASLSKTAAPIETAFVDAARTTGLVATGFVLLGVVFSLLLPARAVIDGAAEAGPAGRRSRRGRSRASAGVEG